MSTGSSVLDLHGRDNGPYRHRPDVVVSAACVQDVASVLAFATEKRVPVTPRGAGTSNGGLAIPLHGGICLDLSRMDRVLDIRPIDATATVEAGVLRHALDARLGPHGLFFPVDPGADASLGGMAATNASGTLTVRHGSMRANVMALQAVLADGSVIRTGTRARKSSAGYELTGLLVGSEGTLAVITELTLRLQPIPERAAAARASFPDVDRACRAVVALSGAGVPLARAELLDAPTIALVNAHNGTSYPELPTLFLEVSGSAASVRDALSELGPLCTEHGAAAIDVEFDHTRRRQLWRARHEFAHALMPRHPGKAIVGTDICVPVSELPGAIAYARGELAARGLESTLVAHAGDGNYHLAFMIDPDSPAEASGFQDLYGALVGDALARGGTCTGEHGIGVRKIAFLEREHGDLIPLMRALKRTFDPAGIMNPGKVLASPGWPTGRARIVEGNDTPDVEETA